ncbi:MAG TPA: hypothetical protein VIA18_03865 [Polyangia bacterium]|jgi:hypothetical protein|nr:hypothetical protein [Polyangia bacterium]
MPSDDDAAHLDAREQLGPLADWPQLGAREAMRALRDLPLQTLTKLHIWEERHLRRTSVLSAIRRAMERASAE